MCPVLPVSTDTIDWVHTQSDIHLQSSASSDEIEHASTLQQQRSPVGRIVAKGSFAVDPIDDHAIYGHRDLQTNLSLFNGASGDRHHLVSSSGANSDDLGRSLAAHHKHLGKAHAQTKADNSPPVEQAQLLFHALEHERKRRTNFLGQTDLVLKSGRQSKRSKLNL